MGKERGPGMFGRREDVEGVRVGEDPKTTAELIALLEAPYVAESHEMSARERKLFQKAKQVVDRFVLEHFSDVQLDIPEELVRINLHDKDALVGNKFIALSEVKRESEIDALRFINAAIHEIIHFYSARRRYVGARDVVDQVGVSVGKSTGQKTKWFEGINEALVSSLETRLFYDFVTQDTEIVSPETRKGFRERREATLSQETRHPVERYTNEELYEWPQKEGDDLIDTGYFSERVFLRMVINRMSQELNQPVEAIQARFDRVAFYGWDADMKRDLIHTLGSDVWRALAWMKPRDFHFRPEDGHPDYLELFIRLAKGETEEAQRVARKIVHERQVDLQYPSRKWGEHAAKDWQDEDIYGDEQDDYPVWMEDMEDRENQ